MRWSFEDQLAHRSRITQEAYDELKRAVLRVEELKISFAPTSRRQTRVEPNGTFEASVNELRISLDNLLADRSFISLAERTRLVLSGSREALDVIRSIEPRFHSTGLNVAQGIVLLLEVTSRWPIASPLHEQPDTVQLRRMIPPQKIAPAQFEIRNGRLSLARRDNHYAARDEQNIKSAREELLRSGERILGELRNSNYDRRLIESVEYLQEQLLQDGGIIRLALSNIGCDMMCGVYGDELPDALTSMLRAHTRGVDMYAAQFPEWNRFLENAATIQIEPQDVANLHRATEKLIGELQNQPQIVDKEVPRTLSQLNSLLSDPSTAPKRVAFALLRSIENLVSKVFSYGADFLDQTVKKSIDDLSTVASKAVVVSLLGIALGSALMISPVAGKVAEMAWLRNATELVQRQMEKLSKE